MKRILFLFVSLLMWGATLPAQQNTRYAVYFETGHHELGEEARQTLDQVLKELQYPEDYSVDIFAHTDSRGSEDYNLKLAERRSKSVNEYLAARGLKTEKTSTHKPSFGAAKIATPRTLVARQTTSRNRPPAIPYALAPLKGIGAAFFYITKSVQLRGPGSPTSARG